MKSREFFELAVRILGAVTLFWGVGYLTESALLYADYVRNPDITFRYYLIYGWINIFVSSILMRAPWILTNFAYPLEESMDEDGDPTVQEPSDS